MADEVTRCTLEVKKKAAL